MHTVSSRLGTQTQDRVCSVYLRSQRRVAGSNVLSRSPPALLVNDLQRGRNHGNSSSQVGVSPRHCFESRLHMCHAHLPTSYPLSQNHCLLLKRLHL